MDKNKILNYHLSKTINNFHCSIAIKTKLNYKFTVLCCFLSPSHAVRATCGGPFWSNAWPPTGQIWADQNYFGHLKLKAKISLGHF